MYDQSRGIIASGKFEADALAETELVVVRPYNQDWDVPSDFDWQTYVSYHPKLRDVGIATEARAKEHYATAGRHQKLVFKRLRVTMRYTACTGLACLHSRPMAANPFKTLPEKKGGGG